MNESPTDTFLGSDVSVKFMASLYQEIPWLVRLGDHSVSPVTSLITVSSNFRCAGLVVSVFHPVGSRARRIRNP